MQKSREYGRNRNFRSVGGAISPLFVWGQSKSYVLK